MGDLEEVVIKKRANKKDSNKTESETDEPESS